jgi:hypothetical protein
MSEAEWIAKFIVFFVIGFLIAQIVIINTRKR